MAFEGLADKLQAAFQKLTSRGKLTEKDVKEAMREVRMALLEADVNYLVVKELGLLNNFWVMILPNLINAWNVLIFKQFFLGIPREMREAAQVDGVSEIRLFWSIMLPLSMPVVASIGLFTMVFHWNSWFDVMIYIDQAHSQLWTLQYYIMINYNNLAQIDSTKLPNFAGGGVTQTTTQMALTIVGFVPILCIYPFFQRFFKDGVYTGAVKG